MLWDEEPPTVSQMQLLPKWVWRLQFRAGTNELQLPIVFPCQSDWQVQYVKDGKTVVSEKAKYLNDQQAHSGGMLVIKYIKMDRDRF